MAVRLSLGLCAFFGLLSGCTRDTPQAACKRGDARACASLGRLYEQGLGVPKDESQAATLFEEACTDGAAEGCVNLGWLYEDGRGVPKDERRAAALFERACRAGMSEACASR
jgi:TPR repeat protein